jgi:hypothetical protein
MISRKAKTVAVENINHPGKVSYLDARMYAAMKRAYLALLGPWFEYPRNRKASTAITAVRTLPGRREGRLVGQNSPARFGSQGRYPQG